MSYNNGPKIITNQLVLLLDSANTKSYPGTGTAWNDLSGNGNNGTLTNGPTFNTSNQGSIVFDGTNDYVECPNLSNIITGSFSISAWVNWTNISSPSIQKIIHIQNSTREINLDNYNGGSGSKKIHFYTSATSSTNNVLTTGETALSNVWYYIVGVYNDTLKFKYLYVNGILKNSASTTVKISWPNSNTRIGYRLNNTEPFNGKINHIKIYNTNLSQSDILQNYNAIKGRFGL